MFYRKSIFISISIVIALSAGQAVVRAQSPAGIDDPVTRAIERIDAAVERRASAADRVIAAAALLSESVTARKLGERERAKVALKRAETIVAEITPSQQSHLLAELARAIAAEHAELNPASLEKLQISFERSLPARKMTRNVAALSGDYQSTLARILIAEGVPIELLAVPFVESRFNPFALSPKGARGIWQLMPATAERYGLTVEPLNDHRIYPEHSTQAAAKYLRDLYQQFGDWKLVLAAYNWGERRVQQVINKTGLRDFNEMARRGLLPLETRNYVPAVLAIWSQLQKSHAEKGERRQ